jgi:hypothetical protein
VPGGTFFLSFEISGYKASAQSRVSLRSTVEVVGPKGRIAGAVVVGPARGETQVEVSLGDGRVLGIDQTNQPRPDPVADWRGQRDQRLADGDFPGYQEIRIEEVPYFVKAADWEFTYNGGGTHVNNRGVVVGPKKAYGFWWQTSGNDWEAAKPVLQIVFDSFRPSPGSAA